MRTKPFTKIFDMSKLKAFADDKIIAAQANISDYGPAGGEGGGEERKYC